MKILIYKKHKIHGKFDLCNAMDYATDQWRIIKVFTHIFALGIFPYPQGHGMFYLIPVPFPFNFSTSSGGLYTYTYIYKFVNPNKIERYETR